MNLSDYMGDFTPTHQHNIHTRLGLSEADNPPLKFLRQEDQGTVYQVEGTTLFLWSGQSDTLVSEDGLTWSFP